MMLTLIKIVKMSIKIVATMRMTKTMMGLSRYAVSMFMPSVRHASAQEKCLGATMIMMMNVAVMMWEP